MEKTKIACLSKRKVIKRNDQFELILRRYPTSHLAVGVNSPQEVALAEQLLALKETAPDLFIECVLAYETVANDWDEPLRDRFFSVMERCDKETMLQTQFTADSLNKMEEYLKKDADIIFVF
ncbi:MAG: hypothetical protein IJU56_07735 [Clostridia bacterium]|nr:hypothetical protein [Clostridia bacterium]